MTKLKNMQTNHSSKIYYYLFVETSKGYHWSRRYAKFASKPMMEHLLEELRLDPYVRIWIVGAVNDVRKHISIGMPESTGLLWDNRGWHHREMPVKPIINRKREPHYGAQ